ncbi:MAG: ribonuclease Z [Clostridia bacterium]|nr:ribonuclease Z [Clostridia bacterium]
MKLTFLGTSHGLIEPERHCSSILLEVGDCAFLIDGGAPVGDILVRRGFPFERVKALFNTHFHDDHIFGCLHFLSLINWYYKSASVDVFIPEAAGVNAVIGLLRAAEPFSELDRVRVREYGDGFSYDENGLSLRAIRTRHLSWAGRPSYSFVAEAEGRKLFFSGDLSDDLSDLSDIVYRERFDLIVIESAHQPIETLLSALRGMNADRVTVNHICPQEEKLPRIASAAKDYPFELRSANDGDEIVF